MNDVSHSLSLNTEFFYEWMRSNKIEWEENEQDQMIFKAHKWEQPIFLYAYFQDLTRNEPEWKGKYNSWLLMADKAHFHLPLMNSW